MTGWSIAEELIREIKIMGNTQNEPVTIKANTAGLSCVGVGTDAAVFYYDQLPAYAFKIYSDKALTKKEMEEDVYLRLQDAPYFPKFYGSGANYLVLSFEEGITLYDCLLQGVSIPEQVILDVEDARTYVRAQGLNPRDIHLKNILLQNGRGKVLDVSEYMKDGNDYRWEHLMSAYYRFYPLINGTKIPSWMLQTTKHWYNRIDQATFALEDFSQQLLQLFFGGRK